MHFITLMVIKDRSFMRALVFIGLLPFTTKPYCIIWVKELSLRSSTFTRQQLIVSKLESKVLVCDKIEETISQRLIQTETLKQSILQQAFDGKLAKLVIKLNKKFLI
jgi:hypothetical protein